MPIYAYRCGECGFEKDVMQKVSDPVLTTCPSCQAERFAKQLTAPGFQLKGSGWYATDFKGSGAAPAAAGDAKADGKTDGNTESKADTKADAKDSKKDKAEIAPDGKPVVRIPVTEKALGSEKAPEKKNGAAAAKN